MGEIQQYKPLLKIETYEKDIYYIDLDRKKSFFEALNKNKFVAIDEVVIQTKDIKKVALHKNQGYEDLPKPIRTKVERMIEVYRGNLGEEPPRKAIKNMVKRATKEHEDNI